MKTLSAIIALILSCLSIQAVTNRPASDFSSVTSLTSTQKFMMLDTNRAASGGIIYVEVPTLLEILSTNPAPNNVKYYGAKGDGVTDDTAAIQTALNAQTVANIAYQNTNTPAGIVTIPAGRYKITAPITIPCGVFIQGAGVDSTVITNAAETTDAIQLQPVTGLAGYGNFRFGIRDLSIRARKWSTGKIINSSLSGYAPWPEIRNVWTYGGMNGLFLSNAVVGSIENLHVDSAAYDGIRSVGTCNAVTLKQTYAFGSALHGFNFESANYGTFINCASEVSGLDGYHMGDINSAHGFGQTTFIGCGAELNRRDGFWFERSLRVALVGCYVGDSYSNAITIQGGSGFDVISCSVAGIPKYGIFMTNGADGNLPSNIEISTSSSMVGFGGANNHPELVNPTLTPSAGTDGLKIGMYSAGGTGSGNTMIGTYAGRYGYTGTNNTGIGSRSMYAYTTGNENTAVGYQSGFGLLGGSANCLFGEHVGWATKESSGNSIYGWKSFYEGTNGDYNSIFGYSSGRGIINGSGNTILGAKVVGLASDLSNNIIIANGTGAIKARNDGTDWTFTGNVSAANLPGITSGTSAPGTTPSKVGDVYIDTSAKKVYFSTGTTSSADWTITN